MAIRKFDVIAVTGEYQDRDGNTKKRFQKCGVVFENERGLSLKLEALPVGSEWNGWLMLMEPREQDRTRGGGGGYSAPAGREQAPSEAFDPDQDIPFATSAGVR